MKRLAFWLLLLLCTFQPLIAQEQKNYLTWMQQHLPAVPEWTAWQQKTGELPPDFKQLKKSNLLLALVAPRPVLVVQPQQDRDADPAAVREAVKRAQEVYALQKAEKKLTLQEPDDYWRLTDATQDQAIQWMKSNL